MNVGLIIGQIRKIGGMEKQAALLGRELEKRGHRVILFISGPRGLRERTDLLGLSSLTRKYLYHTRYSKSFSKRLLRSYCRSNKISHIIAFNVGNAEIAVSANLEAKTAMSVRGTRFIRDAALAKRYGAVAERCDCLISNSNNTADLLRQANIVGRGRIVVIYNGIESPPAAASPSSKRILYVGSLKAVKDPMTFVRACHNVIRTDGDVHVTIAGDGNMRRSIEEYIEANDLAGRFMLAGEIPYEKIPYSDTAVFVNSSLRESSCNSLLEALSFGIPVVATENSGNSEILDQTSNHKLVAPSNADEMAKAISSLLSLDPDRRLAVSEESRALIRKHYSVESMVNRHIELFLNR